MIDISKFSQLEIDSLRKRSRKAIESLQDVLEWSETADKNSNTEDDIRSALSIIAKSLTKW